MHRGRQVLSAPAEEDISGAGDVNDLIFIYRSAVIAETQLRNITSTRRLQADTAPPASRKEAAADPRRAGVNGHTAGEIAARHA